MTWVNVINKRLGPRSLLHAADLPPQSKLRWPRSQALAEARRAPRTAHRVAFLVCPRDRRDLSSGCTLPTAGVRDAAAALGEVRAAEAHVPVRKECGRQQVLSRTHLPSATHCAHAPRHVPPHARHAHLRSSALAVSREPIARSPPTSKEQRLKDQLDAKYLYIHIYLYIYILYIYITCVYIYIYVL